MSYLGIKNLKIVQTEDGKYNVACSYYDSSITDTNNNRVWHKTNNLFKEDINTKEELEYILFKEFLDGNFHVSGNCGKFNCLSWNNCKLVLPVYQQITIQKLWNAQWNFKRGDEVRDKVYSKYSSVRYKYYFKEWQEYLKQEKLENKNKQYYIVKLDFKDNIGVFIKTNNKLCFSISYAKVYHKSLNQVIKELASIKANSNFKNIQVLNVTPYIQKKDRKIYASLDSNQEAQLQPETIL